MKKKLLFLQVDLIHTVVFFATLFSHAQIFATKVIDPETLSKKFDRVLAAMLQKTQAKIAPMFINEIIENIESIREPFAQVAYDFTHNKFIPYKKLNATLSNLYKTVIATEKKLVAIGPQHVRWLIDSTKALEVEAEKACNCGFNPPAGNAILHMTTIFHNNIAPHFAMNVGTSFEKTFDNVFRKPIEWYLRNGWWTIPATAGAVFALYKGTPHIKKLLGIGAATTISVVTKPTLIKIPPVITTPNNPIDLIQNQNQVGISFIDHYERRANHFNNLGCVFRNGENNVSVLKVPCNRQRGLRCGNNALVNSGFLARVNDLSQLITWLNGQRALVLVDNLVNNVREIRGDVNDNGDDLYDNEMAILIGMELGRLNPPVGGNPRRSAIVPNSDNVYRSIVCAANRNQNIFNENVFRGSFSGTYRYGGIRYNGALEAMAARFRDTGRPEIFAVNTGGHWIAVRVERRGNGRVGIVLADSIGGSGIIPPVDRISDNYMILAQLFANNLA